MRRRTRGTFNDTEATSGNATETNQSGRLPRQPEGTKQAPQQKTTSLAAAIKEQFRAAAVAIVQILAPSPAQRRKRREETGKAFQRNGILAKRKRRSLLRFLFDDDYDPGERAEKEKRLIALKDEWSKEADRADFDADAGDECRRRDSHYASFSDFDPQP